MTVIWLTFLLLLAGGMHPRHSGRATARLQSNCLRFRLRHPRSVLLNGACRITLEHGLYTSKLLNIADALMSVYCYSQ